MARKSRKKKHLLRKIIILVFVIIVLFLILAASPREQLDSEALRYVTLLGIAENRGECSLRREKLSREDAAIVENGETDLTRERRVRSNAAGES